MPLPETRPITLTDLRLFDLRAGFPAAVERLRHHLGWKTIRVLSHFARRDLTDNYFVDLDPTTDWNSEALIRHQLKPVLILDDVLRLDLKLNSRDANVILLDIVRSSGARFVEYNVPRIEKNVWQEVDNAERHTFMIQLTERLFNAHITDIQTSPNHLEFKVSACRFVEILRTLNRPHLATFFCEADSQFFSGPGLPVLERPETLASGANCCHFRFKMPED